MKGIVAATKNRFIYFVLLILMVAVSGCGQPTGHTGENLTISCDVAIVGKGMAAFTAALEATQQGAQVLMLVEPGVSAGGLLGEGGGGNSQKGVLDLAEGNDAVGENREGEGEPPPEYDQFSGKGWCFDLITRSSYRDLNWLSREAGLKLLAKPPARYTFANPPGVQKKLLEAVVARGVQVIEQVTITGIEESESPPFFKISLKPVEGLGEEVYARAVILADGGYLNCPAMLKEYAPSVEAAPWYLSGTGKGLQLARELQLDLVALDQFSYILGVQKNGRWDKAVIPEEALLITGREVGAVKGKSQEQLLMALAGDKAGKGEGYLLVAESRLEDREKRELGWPVFTGIDSFMGHYRIDSSELDYRFSRPGERYRGIRIKALASYCLGGVAIDDNCRVLRQGNPVPGLFAAGEITGGLYERSPAPGIALAEAIVLGRRAGAEAAGWSQG